ncbi:permease [Mucilaginibacter segetis]|uniref:Permease n=1 Tax=Mucilaginibacter segetis TaxID=2793071 RepID=A0A934PSQ3_9SPHI|nr:permease [Mucilaginibacter segetis]MBK0378916.1 permease [Mucilaginibacter segetis]
MDKILQVPVEFLHMAWDIYWGLAFGFMLSSIIRAFISTESIASRLGKNNVAAVGMSSFFGAISSSCSYAAASMSRTLLLKGATWSNAVAFMVASTNLVFEIFIVIVSLLGWSFVAGEIVGGIFFIIISSLLIAWVYPSKVKKEAQKEMHESEKREMKGHDHQHMHHDHSSHQHSKAGFKSKLKEAAGYFYMDVLMVGKDILIGVAIASALMVLVPDSFWKNLFLTDNSSLPHIAVLAWNAVAGIIIAILAFVCSVGNIVMAAVLWKGGISFGGVIAFILADLVTVPMLMVYRRYYGLKTMWFLLITLTVCIFITALFLDFSFEALNWLPKSNTGGITHVNNQFTWDWQAWLNVIFIPTSIAYYFWGRRGMKMA